MKFPLVLLITVAAIFLAGCNFTLAEDIPPPPGYVPPSPMPTLGALHPATAPDLQKGAEIFAERCAPCHGISGLGDGPRSLQLPVAVPGIGLPEVARGASPAAWFKMVTQGNLDRFMPPFASALSDEERWDVVSYALSMHTTPEILDTGKALVGADCPECGALFTDQERMAALSADDLVRLIRTGEGSIPAFAGQYTDDDAYAAVTYLRSLTFTEPARAFAPTPSAEAVTTEAPSDSGATPVATLEQPPAAGVAEVRGTVSMAAPGQVEGLSVTLHALDHGMDQTGGPQEVWSLSTTVDADGSYAFSGVEMTDNRIFLAQVEHAGITYRSDFEVADPEATSIELPPIVVYDSTEDVSMLQLEQVHIYTDFANAGTVQVLEIFAFSNTSDKAVIISSDGVTIPFIQLPADAVNRGYEAGQDSAPFVAADDGLAVVPSEKPYSIIAFFNLPYEKSLDFVQPLAVDAQRMLLLVPDGIKVQGDQLSARGPQVIQNNNYQEFAAENLKTGDTLSFTVSGRPRASSATGLDAHQSWLIAGGALGLAFILGGVYLYVRDRRLEPPGAEEAEFQTTDEVLDAILALDDLHRAGKISDEAHARRREELKETLRQLS